MAVRLELPSHFRLHNIFHVVSLLEPHHRSNIPGQPPSPAPIQLLLGEEYEVEQILDSRLFRCQLQYVVLWKGYPISEATWEPTHHLTHAPDIVRAFHECYPHKPRHRFRRRL
jgi:hypothetical protein